MVNKPKKKKIRKTLKQRINALGPAIPGTVRKVKLKCGRLNCRCQSGEERDKHGPYYFWDRKEKGRLTSSSIPKDKVKQFQEWLKNRQTLDKLYMDLLEQGRKQAIQELKNKP